LVQLQLQLAARVAPQRLANAVGSIGHDLGKHVSVLGSHPDLGVAEDLHDHALVDSLGEQKSCGSVPGVVHAGIPDASRPEQCLHSDQSA